MTDPVLTIGELEPLRPTVAVGRNAPDGAWQRWKFRHLDVLLRFMPVRFAYRRELYPLRAPSEFGMRSLQKLRRMQEELASLRDTESEEAAGRYVRLLREVTAIVLDAPADVIESLSPVDHLRIMEIFPRAVTGQLPTGPAPQPLPPTSEPSSPGSIASTAPETG